MTFKDTFMLAANNLRHSEKRTWLTIVGIFIGIAAVVALISIGQGLEQSIDEQFSQIGADKLFIMLDSNSFGTAGGEVSNPLTEDDVQAVKGVLGIAEVVTYSIRSARMEVGDDIGFYYAADIPTDDSYEFFREIMTVDVELGRELRPGDRNNVLVGADYARKDVFLEPLQPGERITINNKTFTVVGILEPIGNAVDDRTVYIPRSAFRDMFAIDDTVDFIAARVDVGFDPTVIGKDVERALLDERDLDEEDQDFSVQTPEQLLASFNDILLIIRVVLVGIAGISLLVGGIGIMNTMYTSVLERTKEIGIFKAIGASPRDILTLFLTEAGLLGFVGGFIGVVVGLALALLVQAIGQAALRTDFLSAYISAWLILGALAFSTVVGMISGYFPARSAAKQNAVDSLRYE